ncbi:MAG: hypothetical protein GWN00_01350 [Aliifodinibius sp.]|nr:hypothetical protein [Fodinibius sp.]NIV09978.1 hypothetical protein [Fodinibius sp.]NIY23508.1 hypothetical protein [Fodinibius sp.]
MKKIIFNKDTATGGGATAMDGIDTSDYRGDSSYKELPEGSFCFVIGETPGESKIYVAKKAEKVPTPDGDRVIVPVDNDLQMEWHLILHATKEDGEMPAGYLGWSDTVLPGYSFYHRGAHRYEVFDTLGGWGYSNPENPIMILHGDIMFFIDPVYATNTSYDVILGVEDNTVANPPASMDITGRVVYDSKIWVFDSDNTPRTYDMDGDVWGTFTAIPGAERTNIMAANVGTDKSYIFGGYLVSDSSYTRIVYEYDHTSDLYTVKASLPGTWEAKGATYNPLDGKIYIVTDENPTGIVSYDPGTNTYDTTLASSSRQLDRLGYGYLGHFDTYRGLVVNFGNQWAEGYDYITDTWNEDMPYDINLSMAYFPAVYYDTVNEIAYVYKQSGWADLYRITGDTPLRLIKD